MRWLKHILSAVAAIVAPAAGAAADPSFVPVFREDFPDAFVLLQGSRFIAYATNNGPNVPMAMSSDLVHWTFVGDANGKPRDALPTLGSWAKKGFTWAPEVIQLGGRYLLYYTASDRRKNAQCIGVAVAADPLGPFVDSNPDPILCQTDLGGSIDASPFRDADGKLYLYFKNDGNRVHARTSLWGQALSPDGLTVSGQPVELLKDDQKWEDRVVEAPTMVRSPLGYELFFSGGFFGWNPEEGGLSPYAMGYASCTGPLGPCTAAARATASPVPRRGPQASRGPAWRNPTASGSSAAWRSPWSRSVTSSCWARSSARVSGSAPWQAWPSSSPPDRRSTGPS